MLDSLKKQRGELVEVTIILRVHGKIEDVNVGINVELG